MVGAPHQHRHSGLLGTSRDRPDGAGPHVDHQKVAAARQRDPVTRRRQGRRHQARAGQHRIVDAPEVTQLADDDQPTPVRLGHCDRRRQGRGAELWQRGDGGRVQIHPDWQRRAARLHPPQQLLKRRHNGDTSRNRGGLRRRRVGQRRGFRSDESESDQHQRSGRDAEPTLTAKNRGSAPCRVSKLADVLGGVLVEPPGPGIVVDGHPDLPGGRGQQPVAAHLAPEQVIKLGQGAADSPSGRSPAPAQRGGGEQVYSHGLGDPVVAGDVPAGSGQATAVRRRKCGEVLGNLSVGHATSCPSSAMVDRSFAHRGPPRRPLERDQGVRRKQTSVDQRANPSRW